MNFALATILVIVTLLPGAVFQRAYYRHLKIKKASIHVPFSEMLFSGILFSLFIHVCAICTLTWFNATPKFLLLYQIVGGKDIVLTDKEFVHIFKQFGAYNISLIIITWVVVKVIKQFIEYYNIHINYYSFRNANYWFEIFSAKYLDRKNVRGKQKNTDLIFVDVLTDTDVIYSGFLKDFNYSPQKDELENLIITTTSRRQLTKAETDQKSALTKPFHIPGDVFLIPMSQIVNINVHYISLSKGHK